MKFFALLSSALVFLAMALRCLRDDGPVWAWAAAALLTALVAGFSGRDEKKESLGQAIFVATSAGLYVAWAWRFIYSTSVRSSDGSGRIYCLFDDAMVSMRYGWNLAHGHGLVWNAGDRLEGFSNLLMTLLMAAGSLFLDALHVSLFIQVLGVLFMLGIAVGARRVFLAVSAHAQGEWRQALSLAVFLLALAYYPLSYWTLFGMETGLLSLLLVWGLALAFEGKPGFQPLFAVLLGLATLTRPDALLPAGLILGYRSLGHLRSGQWGALIREALLLPAFPVAQTGFRLVYYGDLLPNTYYLKLTGLSSDVRWASGWAYTKQLLPSLGLLLGLGLFGSLWRARWGKSLLAGLVVATLLYQTSVGGDPWLYWRFFSPVYPLLALLALEGAAAIVTLTSAALKRSNHRLGTVAVCAALFPGLVAANRAFKDEVVGNAAPMSATSNWVNAIRGLQLKTVLDPRATVGVTWAGALPFFSELRAVDYLGKCDRRLAHKEANAFFGFNGMASVPGHNKYDLRYSIGERKPDFTQVHSWGGDDLKEYTDKHYVRRDSMLIRKDSPFVRWDLFRDGLGKPQP